MRKGLLMKDRDFQLLRHLSYGPVLSRSVLIHIFDTPNANKKTRQRVMTRRLAKHEQEGLIKTMTSNTIRDNIYCLTSKAAPLVSSKFGLELSNIWVNCNEKTVEHDIYVAACARKIYKEGVNDRIFDLASIMLECGLKTKGKLKRGTYCPDILFNIREATGIKSIFMEIDCGTISRADFIGKIRHFEGLIYILTNSVARLNLLIAYLMTEGVEKKVHLACLKDFYSNTLLSCPWHTYECK